MSPKDQRIVSANPGVTPYDLQMTHGLSQGGFNELVAVADEKASNVLKAGTPKLAPAAHLALPAQPVTQPYISGSNGSSQVVLRGRKGSGNGTLMDRGRAEKMVSKYPQDYEIVG